MNKAKAATKTAIFQELATKTSSSRKQVATFFDELTALIHREIRKKDPGIFTLPGLLKIKRVEKPATKARPGRNPATGETITIAAKPKRTVVKVYALKALKDSIK